MKRCRILLPLFALVLVALPACKGSVDDDPILRLSAVESLAEGKRLLEEERFTASRRSTSCS